mgnify:CR=1 FL=1
MEDTILLSKDEKNELEKNEGKNVSGQKFSQQ